MCMYVRVCMYVYVCEGVCVCVCEGVCMCVLKEKAEGDFFGPGACVSK